MKRVGINIILITGLILLLAAIILPFIAEVEFGKAKKLETDYRWRSAGEAYQQVVHLSPLNAEYFAEAGNFMLRQSNYREGEDKIRWLKRAEKLYEHTSQLNPSYAEYWYLLGKTQITQIINRDYTDEGEINRDEVNSAMENFRKAIEKDPYNFRNNYLVGYDLFTVWDKLNNPERDFALYRFKNVLQIRPWYGDFVYPAIIYFAQDFNLVEEVTPQSLRGYKGLYSFIVRNNLWQYRRRVKKSVDFYRQKEEPEEFKQKEENKIEIYRNLLKLAEIGWKGKSSSGENEYKDGNMYWAGTANRIIELPKGEIVVKIQARGDEAYDVWPYMIVELDRGEIGEGFVDSSEWKEYSFAVDTDGGVKVLSVTFPNDGGDLQKGIDRNLYLGEVKINE